MGEIDQRTRKYMSDARVFADAFNFLLFDGQQVLKPEELQAMDPAEIAKLYDDSDFLENEETCRPGGTSTRAKISQIFRDVLKIWGAMRDENAVYVILGIENQTDIHYAMPVRIGFYDFANYKSQVDEIGKRNRMLSKANGISLHSAEFLSGFRREDKLIPGCQWGRFQ